MTIFGTKTLALGGLCALLLGVGHGASAQGYRHDRHMGYGPAGYGRHAGPMKAVRARRHLQVLHAVYNHEIKSGHPEAAMKAHLRAKAIRAHLRAQR